MNERTSPHDVSTTIDRLSDAARAVGMAVFATIDHAAAARDAGLELPDEMVLVFGAPKVGTALMQAAPRAGLDLPLRVLVFDDNGTTRVVYREPSTMAADFPLDDLQDTLERMAGGLDKVVSTAVS